MFANFYLIYGQEVPPPPPLPSNNKSQKNFGEQEVNDNTKIIEANELKEESNNSVCNIQKFKIESKYFTDKNSKYYYRTIESKLNDIDFNISSEEIIAYTKYKNSLEFNPFKIDSIATAIYKLNENSKFEDAIKLCSQLKSISQMITLCVK